MFIKTEFYGRTFIGIPFLALAGNTKSTPPIKGTLYYSFNAFSELTASPSSNRKLVMAVFHAGLLNI